MITTKKLKIWTLVTHGFIIVGAGHVVDNPFPVVALFSFLGQMAILFSLLHPKQILKNIFQIIGLTLLWLSVIYFTYYTTRDSYTHIALETAIPFAICTIITYLGQPIKKFYNWFVDV